MDSGDLSALVLRGQCLLTDLPPLRKKVVRMFMSSTFSDTREERNALMQRVYPELTELCRAKFGLDFQVVDMRWGVPEEASDSHAVMGLCLQEIRKCSHVSLGPYFVTFLGQKYGYRPLPATIAEDEFVAMATVASTRPEPAWDRVCRWYLRDENAVPAVYVLQPISTHIEGYGNKENAELAAQAARAWAAESQALLSTLRQCADAAFADEQKRHYYMSVTESEIREGVSGVCGDYSARRLCILRNISDIQDHLTEPIASRFIDISVTEKARSLDTEAQGLLSSLREDTVKGGIPASNLLEYDIPWQSSGASLAGHNDNNTELEAYLSRLCAEFREKVVSLISRDGAAEAGPQDAGTQEVLQHYHLARARCDVFEGRDDLLQQGLTHLQSDVVAPLVFYGQSGCGKTSVLAKLADLVRTGEQADLNRNNEDSCEAADNKDKVPVDGIESIPDAVGEASTEPSVCEQSEVIAKEGDLVALTTDQSAQADRGSEDSGIDEGDVKAGETSEPRVGSDAAAPTPSSMEPAEKRAASAAITAGPLPNPTEAQKTARPVIVFRFLGTTPFTSNLHQVLVSMCHQLSVVYDGNKEWKEPEKFSDLLKEFSSLLQRASEDAPLYLFLDSIDQLHPGYKSHRVEWLPCPLPAHCRVVLSALEQGYDILRHLRARFPRGSFAEVLPLPQAVSLRILQRWLGRVGRRITAPQTGVVARALAACGLPLFARIAFEQLRRWCSYDQPSEAALQSTVQGAISLLFVTMETKLGAVLVRHSLSYLTCSRHGLSEIELEHLLSLDDVVLGDVFRFWEPPTRRVPPLLWARVRAEVESYLAERSADDTLVLTWYHRQFFAAARGRYLDDPAHVTYIHKVMAEFFLGTWSGGARKPFVYTEQQMKRFGFQSNKGEADRKVPSQPYTFKDTNGNVRYNKRKITELPYQLTRSGQLSLLMREALFNFAWLYHKLLSSSSQDLIEEFGLLVRMEAALMKRPDVKSLFATLKLVRPYIQEFPRSLSVELSGRLLGDLGRSAELDYLIRQCDAHALANGNPIPLTNCFESANVNLEQNITYRKTAPWYDGGAICTSNDFKLIYVLDQGYKSTRIQMWDLSNNERIKEIRIDKKQHIPDGTEPNYIRVALDANDEMLVIFYLLKYITSTDDEESTRKYQNIGHVDVIDLQEGKVVKHVEGLIGKEKSHDFQLTFYNPIVFQIPDVVCVHFAQKITIISLSKDRIVEHSRPHCLTQDCRFWIRNSRDCLRMRNFSMEGELSKRDISEFLNTDAVNGVLLSKDNTLLYVEGPEYGNVQCYNIAQREKWQELIEGNQAGTHVQKAFRSYHIGTSVSGVQEKITTFQGGASDSDFHYRYRVHMVLSPKETYLLVIYQGMEKWECFLFLTTASVRFVSKVCRPHLNTVRYPQFSADERLLILYDGSTVCFHRTTDGTRSHVHRLKQPIRDLVVSDTSLQLAAMLDTEVVIINAEETGDQTSRPGGRKGKKGQGKHGIEIVVAGREREVSGRMNGRLVLHCSDGVWVVSEVVAPSGHAHGRRVPIQVWMNMDGCYSVELYNCPCVVNRLTETIMYTPVDGDELRREGEAAVDIPHLLPEQAHAPPLELGAADSIQSGGKTRYRAQEGDVITSSPSLLIISDINNKSSQQIVSYKVLVQDVTLEHLLISSLRKGVTYISVYDLRTTKLLCVTDIQHEIVSAKMSENVLWVVNGNLKVFYYAFKVGDVDCLKLNKCFTLLETNDRMVPDIFVMDSVEKVVVKYRQHQDTTLKCFYSLVDVGADRTDKQREICLETTTLEDISSDGVCMIDSLLQIYSLVTGDRLSVVSLPYEKHQERLVITARFSPDASRLVVLDRSKLCLNLFGTKEADTGYVCVSQCFVHEDLLDTTRALTLRAGGRVLNIHSVHKQKLTGKATHKQKLSPLGGAQSTSKKDGGTLFLGDSAGQLLETKWLVEKGKYYDVRTANLEMACEKVAFQQFGKRDVIIVVCGIHNVMRGEAQSVICAKINAFLTAARDTHPWAHVFLCTLLSHPAHVAVIAGVNRHLAACAAAEERVHLVDLHAEFLSARVSLLRPDHVHPTPRGAEVMAAHVMKAVKPYNEMFENYDKNPTVDISTDDARNEHSRQIRVCLLLLNKTDGQLQETTYDTIDDRHEYFMSLTSIEVV